MDGSHGRVTIDGGARQMETFHLEIGESPLILLKGVLTDSVSYEESWNPGLNSDSWKENTDLVILATNMKVMGDVFPSN